MYKVTWTTVPKTGNLAGLRLDHDYRTPEQELAVRDARRLFNQPDTVSAMVEDQEGQVLWCAATAE